MRPSSVAIDDLLAEIKATVDAGNRVLVTTLTKIAAEKLHALIAEKGFRARYLHSDFKTTERTDILNGLRAGDFDILVGVSLLREGLDIPEAALIAILDADHAGFLRSASALIQMIGRVARNVDGKAIMYADMVTPAMKAAIDETNARRQRQIAYNQEHRVSPVSSARKLGSNAEDEAFSHSEEFCENLEVLCDRITEKEQGLLAAVDAGDKSRIETLRRQLDGLYRQFIYV